MHNTTPCAIQALNCATNQAEALTELSNNIDDKYEKAEALRLARKAAKQAKRLHSFLAKYVPGQVS